MKPKMYCRFLMVSVVSVFFPCVSQAGLITETVEQAGKVIARSLASEAAETGAKAAAKEAMKKATQEAAEASAKRAASKAVNAVDDIVAKGGLGDNVANFAWRNKGVIVGGAAVGTMIANPESTFASGASMFNSAVESTARHVVAPTIRPLTETMGAFALIWLFAGLMAYLCWDAMHRNRMGFVVKLLIKACFALIGQVRTYLKRSKQQGLFRFERKREGHDILFKKEV